MDFIYLFNFILQLTSKEFPGEVASVGEREVPKSMEIFPAS